MEELKINISNTSIKNEWVVINPCLKNFKSIGLSAKLTGDSTKIDIITDMIRRELHMGVYKEIVKDLLSVENVEYINLMDPYINENKTRHLCDIIISSGYKSLITNGRIVSEISDDMRYKKIPMEKYIITAAFYNDGIIGDCLVNVDSHSKFSDCYICLFDLVEINIGNTKCDRIEDVLRCSVQFDYNIGRCKLLKLVEDVNSDGFKEFISYRREEKIDILLKKDDIK